MKSNGTHWHVVSVRLDTVQFAWVDAIADLRGCSRAAVLREGVCHVAAREHVRVTRTRRLRAIRAAIDAERWDPVGDYINGYLTVGRR